MEQSSGKDYLLSVQRIIKKIHFEEEAGIKRPQDPLEKVSIGKVMPWIVEYAKETGMHIEGYEHEISNYFIRHVIKSHGNGEKEASRGNLPIVDEDFENIPSIIDRPDYAIFGAKRNNEDRIIYVKSIDNGTMLYFEEILTGEKNKSLRGRTMYKTRKILDRDGVLANIQMNRKTDLSKIKITGMDGD
ncbi:hypothetical protein FACS1894151_09920 [Spirochaetia bacterium]|nr:hypothetical protein FACS1894151_09920 [Spirochaetia bacterium]